MSESEWELVIGDETTSCGNWLLSCTTLIKVTKYSEGCLTCPKIVSASASDGSCALATDQVVVHLDKNKLLHMKTKAKVDCMAVLDGGYIVIGDSSGFLTIGVVLSEENGDTRFCPKSSQRLVQCDPSVDCAFRRIIFQLTGHQEAQVIALTSQGSLVVVSNIVLLEGDINLKNVMVNNTSLPRDTLDLVTCRDCFVLLGTGERTISVFSLENNQVILKDYASLYDDKAMTRIWSCGMDMFLTMDAVGKLYLWNLTMLIVVDTFMLSDALDGKVATDLRCIYSHEDDAIYSLNRLSAVVSFEGGFRMLRFPSLECSFEQTTDSNNTIVLSQSPISQDDIFAAQCNADYDDDDDETALSIKFVSYSELDPQRRLDKLLGRRQYDEAEELIKLYNLQVNITPYLVEKCMYNALPTLGEMDACLKSCAKQIAGCNKKTDFMSAVSYQLSQLQYRLESFVKIFGEGAYSPDAWQMFQQSDLLETFTTLFASQKQVQAFRLWHCFRTVLFNNYKPGLVGRILCSVTLTPAIYEKLLDWLVVDIIPILTSTYDFADEMLDIVRWTLTVIEYHKPEWSSNAIDLCSKMVECFQTNLPKFDERAAIWDEQTLMEEIIEPLRETLECLTWVDELKTKFNCHLPFDVVRKETKESLVYRMLDKVNVIDHLPIVLQTQILPYMKCNNLNADEIFASYVKDIMQRRDRGVIDDYVWRQRIKAIIDVIQEPKDKVGAVLNLIENSRLPFADFVEDTVESVLGSITHPLIADLEKQWQTLQAANLMTLYGLEPFALTAKKALVVARYFIHQDRASSMADAKKLMSALGTDHEYTLALYQTRFYMNNNRMSDLKTFIKSLPAATLKKCAKWCLDLGQAHMTSFRHSQAAVEKVYREQRLQFYSAGILCGHILINDVVCQDPLEMEEIKKTHRKIQTARTLETKYDFGIDSTDLEDEEKCSNIFKMQLRNSHEQPVLLRIAELLDMKREVAFSLMIEDKASNECYDETAQLTKCLCECPNISKSSCSYDTAVKLVRLGQTRYLPLASDLVNHALLTCRGEEIKSRLELAKEIRSLETVKSHSQEKDIGELDLEKAISDDGTIFKPSDLDLMDNGYKEAKLPLNRQDTTNTEKVLALCRQEEVSKKEIQVPLGASISALSSKGHDNLALDILNHVQHHVHQACPETATMISKAIIKVSSSMLGKVLKQSPMDMNLALPLALHLHQSNIYTLLEHEMKPSLSVNHNKRKKMLEVMKAYAEQNGDEDMVHHCHHLSQHEKWRNRLAKIGLTLEPMSTVSSMLHMVTNLMLDHHTNFQLVQEFIMDLDLDAVVIEQEHVSLFQSVLAQAPVVPTALEKASRLLKSIEDEDTRRDAIQDALSKTSEYNYEVLQFLMEQLDLLEDAEENRKAMALLKLLTDYQRQSPPGDDEEFGGSGSQSDDILSVGLLIPTSGSTVTFAAKMSSWVRQQRQQRLPFRLLQGRKMKKIMGPELTTSTLPYWLLIASELGKHKDEILISFASKLISFYAKLSAGESETAASTKSMSGPVDDGLISKDFLCLLKELEPILYQVDGIECVIWLCNAAVSKFHKVGDKVKVLEHGLAIATKWMDSTEGKDESSAERAAEIFSSKIPPMSTQWSLVKAGLGAKEELKPLVSWPEKLIHQLYHLPLKAVGSIKHQRVESYQEEAYDESAIHTACEEIAKIYEIDLLFIQTALVELWVTGSESSDSNDADQTMFNIPTEFDLSCDTEDNMPRIMSMLRCANGEAHQKRLVSILRRDDDSLSMNSRKTAILCCVECDLATDEMRKELKLVCQLTGLQKLGVNLTPDMFLQANKELFLTRLWDKYKTQEEAVPLLASMCLEQGMTTQDLWNSILTQMVKYNMRASARTLLMKLMKAKGMEMVYKTDGFVQATRMLQD